MMGAAEMVGAVAVGRKLYQDATQRDGLCNGPFAAHGFAVVGDRRNEVTGAWTFQDQLTQFERMTSISISAACANTIAPR